VGEAQFISRPWHGVPDLAERLQAGNDAQWALSDFRRSARTITGMMKITRDRERPGP